MNNVSAADLRRAATIKDKIEELESELSKLLGTEVGNGRTTNSDKVSDGRKAGKGRRKMSASARAKIAAAAKARWAKRKAAGKNSL